jgi:hypothetical protein
MYKMPFFPVSGRSLNCPRLAKMNSHVRCSSGSRSAVERISTATMCTQFHQFCSNVQAVSKSGRLCCDALTPDLLFTVSTACMIPTYGMLMISGRVPFLHRSLTSHGVPFVLSLGWIAAICVAAFDTASTFPQVIERATWSLHAGVASASSMFMKKWFTTIFWMNVLMLDFLMAREIALDAPAMGVFAAHSLLLCFMCGPIGYLSHQATKGVYNAFRGKGGMAAAKGV